MLRKNSAENIHYLSARIIATGRLPKDFFKNGGRASKSVEKCKKEEGKVDKVLEDDSKRRNQFLFTFCRSKSGEVTTRPF